MATVIHGHSATLTYAGSGATIVTSWTLDMSVQIIDITSLDDNKSGWIERTTGRMTYTATVDAIDPTFTVADIGSVKTLTLTDGGSTNSIALLNAMLTSVNKTLDSEDIVRTTLNFECGGNAFATT